MPSPDRFLTAIAGLVVLVLVGCTAAAPQSTSTPRSAASSTPGASSTSGGSMLPSAAPPGASALAASPSTAAGSRPATGDSWLVVGRAGVPGTRVILASTGEVLYDLPDGVPDATWGRVLAATADGTTTTVRDLVVQPGFGGSTETLEGRWRLPTIGSDPTPVGVSADGKTAVLVEDRKATHAAPIHSRFAIVKVPFVEGWAKTAPRVVELPGEFEYDALSPNGSTLYVVEHLAGPPAGHYQVRTVDVATGRLRPEVVVDKTGDDEAMAGYPIAQLRRADGMVFTLYQGVEHPFIHALESTDAWALCIDLPTSNAAPASTTSGPANRDWGMAFMPDGQSLVAANSTIGLAVKIESDLTVHRVARFDPTASGAVTLAKFGHNDAVTAGQRVVMARNGSALYAAGSNGVVRLGPDDLTVLGRLLPGVAVTTLAVTNDRTRLFTLTGDGRILEVDLATESVVRAVEGGPFDRLVAVVPW